MHRTSLCAFCQYKKKRETERAVAGCSAFDHIPREILLGQNEHLSPMEGDRGVVFKMADDLPQTVRLYVEERVARAKEREARRLQESANV